MIIDATKEKENVIGRLGENDATVIRFPVGDIVSEFPGCSFNLVNRRPKDKDGYPVLAIEHDRNYVLWTVTSSDLSQEGIGECELIATQDNVVKKTIIYTTRIYHAIDGSGTPPEPWESWVQHVKDDADRADAAADLLRNANAEAETLEPDQPATASYSDGTFYFGIPRGEDCDVQIDDTAGAGDTDKVWSADKDVQELELKADKAYTEKISVINYIEKNKLEYPLLDRLYDSYRVIILPSDLCCILRTEQPTWEEYYEYLPYFAVTFKDALPAGTPFSFKFDYSVRSTEDGRTYGTIRFLIKHLYSDGTESAGNYHDGYFDYLNDWKTYTYTSQSGLGKDCVGIKISTRAMSYPPTSSIPLCAFDFKNLIFSTEEVTWDYSVRDAVAKKANAKDTVLYTSLSRGRKENTPVGGGSFAFGDDVEASVGISFAIGRKTKSSGSYSSAKGMNTIASGDYANAQGYLTEASGEAADAQGRGTIANHKAQRASGMYNVADTRATDSFEKGYYADIVGNGTDSSHRSNAYTLDWNGNARFKGDVYAGCNADSSGGTVLAKITDIPDISGKIDSSEKGAANGVAELDGTGRVPSTQLPSYVDDIEEYEDREHFPVAGETGKIYVALDTNKVYRWGGQDYVEISESLALGETSSTAFRGDHGKIAYDHASAKGSEFTSGLYKIQTNTEGHVTGAVAVQKADITALGIPAQDTTYEDATQSVHGLMSIADKIKLDGLVVASVAETQAIIDEYGEVSA